LGTPSIIFSNGVKTAIRPSVVVVIVLLPTDRIVYTDFLPGLDVRKSTARRGLEPRSTSHRTNVLALLPP
jgi:hypothetical protein